MDSSGEHSRAQEQHSIQTIVILKQKLEEAQRIIMAFERRVEGLTTEKAQIMHQLHQMQQMQQSQGGNSRLLSSERQKWEHSL